MQQDCRVSHNCKGDWCAPRYVAPCKRAGLVSTTVRSTAPIQSEVGSKTQIGFNSACTSNQYSPHLLHIQRHIDVAHPMRPFRNSAKWEAHNDYHWLPFAGYKAAPLPCFVPFIHACGGRADNLHDYPASTQTIGNLKRILFVLVR